MLPILFIPIDQSIFYIVLFHKREDIYLFQIQFRINILGSGSDFASFMYVVGVPSLDMRYTFQEVYFK